MDIFDSSYWKLAVISQKVMGLFVFQNNWIIYIPRIGVCVFLLSIAITVGIRLYMELGVNTDIVIENVIGEIYVFVISLKLFLIIISKKKMKTVYEKVARDWKIISDAEELRVMHEYTEAGRKMTVMYTIFILIGVSIFLCLPIAFPLLDYIMSVENMTRLRKLPYYAEYGIDQDKYYYPLMAQAVVGGTGTIIVLIAFDLGYMMIIQHIVALFAVVNCRLIKVSQISNGIEKRLIKFLDGDRKAYYYIVKAINLHQTGIQYVNLAENCYSVSLFLILFLNMVMFGGGLTVVFYKNEPEELVRYGLVMISGLIHFYYMFLPGQKIIDSSLEVLQICYSCKWYNLSEKTKNLLKILLIRSMRRCELTGGKMFVLCMETYCNMMKTGFSIFTFIKS